MRRGAIIQLVRATRAKATTGNRTGRGRLPQTRRHCLTVLRYPGSECALLTTAKPPKPALYTISELSGDPIKNLRRYLSSPIERVKEEEAHRTLRN